VVRVSSFVAPFAACCYVGLCLCSIVGSAAPCSASDVEIGAFWQSLFLSIFATITAVLVAAVIVARYWPRAPWLLSAALALPILMNTLAFLYGSRRALEIAGATLLGDSQILSASFWSIPFALSLLAIPYAAFPFVEASIRASKKHRFALDFLRASGEDSSTAINRLWGVVIADAFPKAALFTFCMMFPFYFTPKYLGNETIESISNAQHTRIHAPVSGLEEHGIDFLVALPVVLAFVLFLLISRKRANRLVAEKTVKALVLAARSFAAPLFLLGVVGFSLFVFLLLVLFAFNDGGAFVLARGLTPTVRNFADLFTNQEWGLAAANSAIVGLLAGAAAVSGWYLFAIRARRAGSGDSLRSTEILAGLPIAIPFAVGAPLLHGGIGLLPDVLEYSLFYSLSLGLLAVVFQKDAINGIPQSVVLAHRSLGGSIGHFCQKVGLFYCWPSLVVAVAFVFIFVINEPVGPQYMITPGTKLVAGLLYSGTHAGHSPLAPAAGLIICLGGLAAIGCLRAFSRSGAGRCSN